MVHGGGGGKIGRGEKKFGLWTQIIFTSATRHQENNCPLVTFLLLHPEKKCKKRSNVHRHVFTLPISTIASFIIYVATCPTRCNLTKKVSSSSTFYTYIYGDHSAHIFPSSFSHPHMNSSCVSESEQFFFTHQRKNILLSIHTGKNNGEWREQKCIYGLPPFYCIQNVIIFF